MNLDLIEFFALKRSLHKQKEIKLRVVSDSMAPLLKVDEIIRVHEFHPTELVKYDIVVFWQNNKIISHFLWSKQTDPHTGENIYITKSLKDPRGFDIPVKERLLLGRVDAKITRLTKIKVSLINLLK